ncbi:Protein translocase subunit SecA [Clostridium bornimense]|uniref:Protein translocase subunit SecA n=1 Tax=Clostridium bornimense TaxID=1216932 RepID=W6S516_9CLOT|nr:preprotein translocase subunit SecA [Clostridium bornimense]CDM69402.1 Protein translocase subunit SecA [Clostridium bornimense]
MGLFSKIFGTYSERQVKGILPLVDKIEALDSTMQNLSDEELRDKTTEFKERLKNGETLDDILPEAFAVVREGAYRAIGLKAYREQLIGGIVLHQGRISEMKTGEGKTLVATLPAYLNALTGKGVHIITVNDYLAKRDRDQMSQVYGFLGLETGVILHGLTGDQRREAYNCDITYGTNSEFGFDYLRDNMVVYLEEKVQRGLNYVIVDEVDSILIDEARTPLIISGQGEKSTDFYKVADFFVKTLKKEEDFTIDEKTKSVILTDAGVEKAEKYYHIDNYADAENMRIQHHTVQALRANYIMNNEIDYIVKDNSVVIVDEFTGRVMEGRRYSDGLHQAIEAKEGVKIESESKTLATITYQNYFRMYNKLAGMTGTAITEENEFREIYGLDVLEIPTHLPIARIDQPDLVYKTTKGKFEAIVNEIEETHRTGQPMLVGTVSIENSELVSSLLKKRGIPHQVLNAKYHEKEAEIISRAGEKGAVTIATNMAGRGTDIKLGEGVLEVGGLKIIGTERHESRRIDNQLRGRSGRQGDKGESRFYVSLEDDLMRIFGSERIQGVVEKLGLEENEAIESKMVSSAIESAQKKVEGNNFDVRKSLLQYDDVMNKQREIIYAQRNSVLQGENLKDYIMAMIEDVVESGVNGHLTGVEESVDDEIKKLIAYFDDLFLLKGAVKEEDLDNLDNEGIIKYYKEVVMKAYAAREEIVKDEMREIERVILLRVVDTKWMDHIDSMEHLKQYIGLRSYKQQDPVQAYQFEGSEMFEEMIQGIKLDTVRYLYHIEIEKKEPQIERERVAVETTTNYDEAAANEPKKRTEPKIGRNDPCPCGSGQKYKNCCGRGK